VGEEEDLEAFFDDDFDETELLKEIAADELRDRLERDAAQAAAAAAGKPQGGMQLSAFQEEIISTGSGVATVLLYILAFLFIIRALQVLYERLTKMSMLNEVKSVISEAKVIASHKVGDFFNPSKGITGNYRITYCTEYEYKTAYEKALEDEAGNYMKLKNLMVKRAKELLMRGMILDRDRLGMSKSFQMDMVPMAVFNDFNDAQKQLDIEARLVNLEVVDKGFLFGKHGPNVFSFANELINYEKERNRVEEQIRIGKQKPVPNKRRRNKKRFPTK